MTAREEEAAWVAANGELGQRWKEMMARHENGVRDPDASFQLTIDLINAAVEKLNEVRFLLEGGRRDS